MTTSRIAAYIGGSVLLLAWLASASGLTRSSAPPRVPAQPGDAAMFQTIASDVQSQATRLRSRLATAPAPAASVRNPFAFAARAPREAAGTRRRAVVTPAPGLASQPAVFEPPLTLVGIAEETTPLGIVRTAMITAGGDELFMASVGKSLLSRYRVIAVGADAVELQDGLTGTIRRLVLQQ